MLIKLLLKVLQNLDEVLFVLSDYISDALFPVLKSHYEEGQQHEQLLLDALLIVSQAAELLHDVLQVFFVVHEVVRELRIETHFCQLFLAVHLVTVILLTLFLP